MPEVRIALVIGNAAYRHVQPLDKPINDAKAIANKLEALGFTTDILVNQSLAQLREAFKGYREKVSFADVAVVYYAGHGIEVLGRNYLVPIDAKLENPKTRDEIEDEVYSVSRVLENTEDARRLQLIILDCCRDDPFGDITRSLKAATRGVGQHRGLAPLPSRMDGNSLIAYAAEPGSTAYDGEVGDLHSPYVGALLEHIGTPGDDIQTTFSKVRGTVIEKTRATKEGKSQAPQAPTFFSGIRIPAIYLAPDPVEAHWLQIKLSSDPAVFDEFANSFPDHPKAKDAKLLAAALRHEAEEWERIKDSNDPQVFRKHRETFPNGAHDAEARKRFETLPVYKHSPSEVKRNAIVGFASLGVALGVAIKIWGLQGLKILGFGIVACVTTGVCRPKPIPEPSTVVYGCSAVSSQQVCNGRSDCVWANNSCVKYIAPVPPTSLSGCAFVSGEIACNARSDCIWRNNACVKYSAPVPPTSLSGCAFVSGETACNARSDCIWSNNVCENIALVPPTFLSGCAFVSGETACNARSDCIWRNNACVKYTAPTFPWTFDSVLVKKCSEYSSRSECSVRAGCTWLLNKCY